MSENKGIVHAFSLEEGNFLVPKVRVFGIKGPFSVINYQLKGFILSFKNHMFTISHVSGRTGEVGCRI